MQLTEEQFERIKDCLPRQRGNVRMDSLNVLNAILFVAENGCRWRRLPERHGRWHSVYMRMSRWSKEGVLDRIFTRLQTERMMEVKIQAVSLDGTTAKVHPDGAGARKKTGLRPSGFPAEEGGQRFIWLPRMTGSL